MRAITIWALLSLAWAGGVAAYAARSWPRVPLDMSRADPATIAALNRAIFEHAASHAVLALLPTLLMLALVWRVLRRAKSASAP